MQKASLFQKYIYLMITANIFLQIIAFCLMKTSWIHANHSLFKMINYVTVLAFSAVFLRAYLWQRILTINDLVSSYLPNAIVPSLLLLAGYFIFHEKITVFNILGTMIIFIGLICLIKSTRQQ
jgi:drug/metabolite transporter (DMT)-like permease